MHSPRDYSKGGDPCRGGDSRRGSVLVEFALVAFVLYLILAGGVEMGRAVFCAQVLQEVARTAARELALTRVPATATFEEALTNCAVRQKVYDERWLVIDLDEHPEGRELDLLFSQLPIVNQMLRPLMIVDRVKVRGRERRLLRYPGALLYNSKVDHCMFGPAEFTVGVPMVIKYRGNRGYEAIRWVPVLEEVRPDPDNRFSGPFSVIARGSGRSAVNTLKRGIVSLRINYPYQAAMLSGFRSPNGPFEKNGKRIIAADDGRVLMQNEPPGRFVFPPRPGGVIDEAGLVGPYAGTFGLGRQFALGQVVRPFRKLISAQAVFRREAFD